MRPFRTLALTLPFFVAVIATGQTAKRAINLDDLSRLKDVADPQVSPDGSWVVYTVSTVDRDADKRVTHLWLASWDGKEQLQLTHDAESASSPRWSPDGQFISFVSSRAGKAKGSQVWVLDRRGGEAYQLTHLKNFDISAQSWAPDCKHLLLVLKEKDEPEAEDSKPAPNKAPKPIVIDRYHFKQDVQGYLSGTKRNHIYLFDTKTEALEQITNGVWDETGALMSPDGTKIAYISSADKDPDRTLNTDVFVIDAKPKSVPRKLTDFPGPDRGKLAWSPDSQQIAYLQSSEARYSAYSMSRLAVVSAKGSEGKVVAPSFDRPMSQPVFLSDGQHVMVLVADDRLEFPAVVSLANGQVDCPFKEPETVNTISAQGGHVVLFASNDGARLRSSRMKTTSFAKLHIKMMLCFRN